MYDNGNPGEINFGLSQCEVGASEGSSYWESTIVLLFDTINGKSKIKKKLQPIQTTVKTACKNLLI